MSITHKQRQTLVDTFYWFHQHSNLWPYVESRPFPVRTRNEIEALISANREISGYDCSGSTIEGFYIAGLKDPSGNNFNGLGNTSEMLIRLARAAYTNPARALPGALAVFNANLPLNRQHVAVVGDEGNGTINPIMFTHGSAGFQRLRLEELQPGFSGKTLFLSPGQLG